VLLLPTWFTLASHDLLRGTVSSVVEEVEGIDESGGSSYTYAMGAKEEAFGERYYRKVCGSCRCE